MGYKEVLRVDISEVIRRWQAIGSRRRTASGMGLSRETVGKYISLAEGMRVSRQGLAPTEDQLGRLAPISRPGPQHGAVIEGSSYRELQSPHRKLRGLE